MGGSRPPSWHCLSLKLPVEEEDIVPVISSCVILHNACRQHGHDIESPDVAPGPIRIPLPTEPPSRIRDRKHAEEEEEQEQCVMC